MKARCPDVSKTSAPCPLRRLAGLKFLAQLPALNAVWRSLFTSALVVTCRGAGEPGPVVCSWRERGPRAVLAKFRVGQGALTLRLGACDQGTSVVKSRYVAAMLPCCDANNQMPGSGWQPTCQRTWAFKETMGVVAPDGPCALHYCQPPKTHLDNSMGGAGKTPLAEHKSRATLPTLSKSLPA